MKWRYCCIFRTVSSWVSELISLTLWRNLVSSFSDNEMTALQKYVPNDSVGNRLPHACNRQTSSNKLLLIKDVSSVHQFYDSENFSNYYLPHQSPLLLSWCGEVTNRSINLCFLTFWQESSNLSCMRLMKWRYCCIFVPKII